MVKLLLPFYLFTFLLFSCSENTGEEEEFANWQAQNEAFFASLEDSLRQAPDKWVKLKNFSLDQTTEGKVSDYVYAKKIETSQETESPMYTDSIRVSYQGRLLPSLSYADGYVFDGTVYGKYDIRTNDTAKFKLSGLIAGWVTPLLHMHRGDYWRIYIPSDMGYGDSGNGSSIPGYSVLVFDMTLIDFSPVGEVMRIYR